MRIGRGAPTFQRARLRGHGPSSRRVWIKIKPAETHDLAIIGFVEGRRKHIGRLGYVNTAKGDVGSGFTDIEREILWAEAKAERLVGQVIEVSCLQITPAGRFRHPSLVRMRPDKLFA